ncbi:MAG: hypothetical protein WCN92_01055 [Eubacteriales bacterium]
MLRRRLKFKHNIPSKKKSFSDFSQSYSDGLNGNKLSYNEKMKRLNIVKWVLISLGILAIFIVAYIFTNVMLNISQKPIETTTATLLSSLPTSH